jgi:hypothetical protein
VKYRVTVYVDNDQYNPNNTLSKIFTLTLKRQAVLVSYTTKNASGLADAKGLANKDSVTRGLRRLGIQFDSLDRSTYGGNAIDYSAGGQSSGQPVPRHRRITISLHPARHLASALSA